MRAVLLPVGQSGLDYVAASLGQGLTLGRTAATCVEVMTANAFVPRIELSDRLFEFAVGGVGGSTVSVLGEFLVDRYRGWTLFVELPLWRPTDRSLAVDEFDTLVRNTDVYALCELGDPVAKVDATVRSADPSYMYNAIVLRGDYKVWADPTMERWPNNVAESVLATITGAYDGEGFVVASELA